MWVNYKIQLLIFDFNQTNIIIKLYIGEDTKRMGCTNSNAETPSVKIINVESKTVNIYMDQIPLYIIQKIKQKFDSYCDNKFQLSESQFKILYSLYFKNNLLTQSNSNSAITYNNQVIRKLYQYYTDARFFKLTFKKFMAKYAILSKSDSKLLTQILFFLYSISKNQQNLMSKQDYDKFIVQERKNFSFQPSKSNQNAISKSLFEKYLIQSGFSWEDSRKKFLLIDKDDVPFQAITRGLIDMNIDDFNIGEEYYVLSSSWFQRWSYYYQGITVEDEDLNYKSTKIIKRIGSINSGKKRKSFQNRSSSSRHDVSINENSWIIQRPSFISFEDIEGQYKGELKQNIKATQQTRILSKQLWELFKKTMPAETQFKRTANSLDKLDLYPKSIYYLQTDGDGNIMDSSLKIVQLSLKRKLQEVTSLYNADSKQKNSKNISYFIKNFGQSLWNEQKQQAALGMCSVNTRFFLVETTNRSQFIEKYFRNKKVRKNVTYGDKIYSFFSFNKKIMPAYVIRLPSEKTALIHYLNFNFRYEIEVSREQIDIEQDVLAESIKKQNVKKPQDQFSFKGIQNIGNTCFINSVIQCLIASPILQNYFKIKKFKQQKQSLLYQISDLAVALLANKKVSPVKLKKTIDMQLQIFSGNDQHDAQQFLSFLIDKLNKQLKEFQRQEETVFEHLFKGKVQSTLECLDCQAVKKIEEELSIVSLPIPEPQFNTFTIYVFPIYQNKIKRVILRLHRNSKSDYLTVFEQRIGKDCEDFLFIQVHSGNFKKIRNDIFDKQQRRKLLIEANISPSIEIHCFERFRKSQFSAIQQQNRRNFKQSEYFDFFDKQNERWLYGRYMDKKSKIEIMNQDNSFSVVKNKQSLSEMKPLGDKTRQFINKKFMTRRYNATLQKMELFSIHYMVGFPKQVNYFQLQKLINLVMSNFVTSTSAAKSSRKKILPYIIRIYQTNKLKCLYCNAVQSKISSKQEVQRCCKLTEEQMSTPIMWIAKERAYTIFIDWSNLDQLNTDFNAVETDNLSAMAEKMSNNDKIQIEQCLKLYQKPENVEMECDKCKHKHQIRTQTMKYVPNILILHMKQYRITQDMNLVKMNVNLKWMEFLDITKYSLGQKGSVYELYAYVRHFGTSQSGHYTCAIKRKHPFQNKKVWVNFDDESTEILDSEQKNIDSAYLLFFKRIDMPNSAYVNFTNL